MGYTLESYEIGLGGRLSSHNDERDERDRTAWDLFCARARDAVNEAERQTKADFPDTELWSV